MPRSLRSSARLPTSPPLRSRPSSRGARSRASPERILANRTSAKSRQEPLSAPRRPRGRAGAERREVSGLIRPSVHGRFRHRATPGPNELGPPSRRTAAGHSGAPLQRPSSPPSEGGRGGGLERAKSRGESGGTAGGGVEAREETLEAGPFARTCGRGGERDQPPSPMQGREGPGLTLRQRWGLAPFKSAAAPGRRAGRPGQPRGRNPLAGSRGRASRRGVASRRRARGSCPPPRSSPSEVRAGS